MNILFLADNFPPEKNAQASRVYERACYWVKWGHQVTVVTCAPNFPEGKVYTGYKNRWHQAETMSGIRVVRVKTFIRANAGMVLRILDFVSYMFTAFGAGLFERRPDLVVATSPQFFAAVCGWALAGVKRVPFVFELGDLWPESIIAVGAMKTNVLLKGLEKVELFLYRRAAAIVALAYAFKANLVRRGIPENKIAVVRNGVDLDRYGRQTRDVALGAEWGLNDSHFVVGYIGTLGMAHGLDNVLNAAEWLRGTPARFLFVGPGAVRDHLIAEAQRRGLDNVIFVPPQPKQRMPAFWSLCDVALVHLKNSPVFATVMPSKIFEAMGMGLPVLLAAPEGEASQIVVDEKIGIWAPAEDPKALADAVLLLKEDEPLRRRFADASYAAASSHTRERQAREMLQVLNSVAGGPREASP